MFTATYDGEVLHDPRDVELTALDQSASLKLTEAGSYVFTLPPTHPLAGKLQVMNRAKEVVVCDDGEEVFRGRVRSMTKLDTYGYWSYECEGERAYLNDVCLPVYQTGEGDAPTSADALFEWYIGQYNAKVPARDRFTVGVNEGWRIRPGDNLDRSSEQNPTVWAEIKKKLIDALGGYVRVRHDGGTRYIDWLSDGTRECAQRVEFGENLTDFAYDEDGTELFTRIVPWGTRDEKTTNADGEEETEQVRFGIGELPDQGLAEGYEKIGDAVVSVELEDAHGVIEKYAEYRDVTSAETLMADALQDLVNSRIATSLQVSAIDLHRVDPSVERIALGDFVRVTSRPHGFDAYMLCTEIDLDMSRADSTYTLGTAYDTLTGDQSARLAQLTLKLNEQTEAAEATSAEAKAAAESAAEALTKLANLKGAFVHICYAENAAGLNMTVQPNAATKYIGIVSDSSEQAPTDPAAYAWSLIKGADGVKGETGADGTSSYLHVKWSDDGKAFTADGGEAVGDWMGTCVTSEEADPTSFSDYTWVKVKGEDGAQGLRGLQGPQGEQGIQGPKGDTGATGATGAAGKDGKDGADGKTTYFHIKYSPVASPTASQMTETPSAYIGTYVDYTQADSADPSAYTWSRFQGLQGETGEQGIPGTNGADGKTSYLHIAYADSADGKTGFDVGDSTGKSYIGQYTDFTSADSTDPAKYSWTLIKGDKGDTGAAGKGIKSVTNYYLATASASGVTTSTSGWTTSVQSLSATKKYLWNYEVIAYTDNTSTTSTPCVIGVYGDKGATGADGAKGDTGNGIGSIAEHYAVSASNSTAPTSWSETVPTMTTANKYLWNYETITYTDGTSKDTSKRVIGAYGNTGATGAKGDTGATGATGATGKGVKAIKPQYYLSTSNTSQAGGSWVDACPTWTSGHYIWTRSYVTWTDGTTSTTTPALDSGLNTANTTANTANTTANSAKSTANSAYNAATAVNLIPGFCAQASGFYALHANWKRTAGHRDSVGGSSGWGWLNKVDNSSGSSTVWVNVYDAPCASMSSSAAAYTLLVEWSGVTYTGTAPTFYAGKSGSAAIPQFSNSGSVALTNGAGSAYFSLTSTAASTARTADTCTRITIKVPAYSTLQGSFRFSLYKGSYSGPYVPPAGSVAMERASTLIRATSSGLEVGKVKADNTRSGPYCLVNSSGSYDIYSQDSVRLSSFGASSVELGENSTSSVINMCGGMGRVSVSEGFVYYTGKNGAVLTYTESGQDGIGITGEYDEVSHSLKNEVARIVASTVYLSATTYNFGSEISLTSNQMTARLVVPMVGAYCNAATTLTGESRLIPMGYVYNSQGSSFTATGGGFKCNFSGYALVSGAIRFTGATVGSSIEVGAYLVGTAQTKGVKLSGGSGTGSTAYITPTANGGAVLAPQLVKVTQGQYIYFWAANWSASNGTINVYTASGGKGTNFFLMRVA